MMTDETPDQVLEERPELDTDDHDSRAGFHITDDATANWALRLLAATEAERERLRSGIELEIQRLEARRVALLGPVESKVSWLRGVLASYYRDLERQRGAGMPKTYRLAYGALKRRAGSDRAEVTDDAAFLAWAVTECPEAVRVPEPKPLVSALSTKAGFRKVDGMVVDPNGQEVPGVVVHHGEPTYTVDLAEPAGWPEVPANEAGF